jgi:exonuclease SbcD
MASHAPVHYSGSPLAVDFGEQENTQVVCLVSATPGAPARVTDVPITSGRRLRTVHGTLADLSARKDEFGEDYLRVFLTEPVRAGLRDDAAEILPNALEVRVDPEFSNNKSFVLTDNPDSPRPGPAAVRTPDQLFADYCAERQVGDPRVAALFRELHDEVVSGSDSRGA